MLLRLKDGGGGAALNTSDKRLVHDGEKKISKLVLYYGSNLKPGRQNKKNTDFQTSKDVRILFPVMLFSLCQAEFLPY